MNYVKRIILQFFSYFFSPSIIIVFTFIHLDFLTNLMNLFNFFLIPCFLLIQINFLGFLFTLFSLPLSLLFLHFNNFFLLLDYLRLRCIAQHSPLFEPNFILNLSTLFLSQHQLNHRQSPFNAQSFSRCCY